MPPERRLEAFRMNGRGWDAQTLCLQQQAGNWLGDDEFAQGANGTVVDAGGAGSPVITGVATSIPTLSQWGMLLLASLVAFAAMVFVRRRGPG